METKPHPARWTYRELSVPLDLPTASHPAVRHPHLTADVLERGNRILAARMDELAQSGWVPAVASDMLSLWRAKGIRWREQPGSAIIGGGAFRLENAKLWVKRPLD